MAEPFSVAQGAIALAGTGINIANGLKVYIDTARKAQKSLRPIVRDVETVCGILTRIGTVLENNEITKHLNTQFFTITKNALDNCQENFQALRLFVVGLALLDGNEIKVTISARLKLYFKQHDLDGLRGNLRDSKASLDLMVGMLQIVITMRTAFKNSTAVEDLKRHLEDRLCPKSEKQEEHEVLTPTTARSSTFVTQTSNWCNSLGSDSSQIASRSTYTSETERNPKIQGFSSKPSSKETSRNLDELPDVSIMAHWQPRQPQLAVANDDFRARTLSNAATPFARNPKKASIASKPAISAGVYFMSCLADATRVSSELKFETLELTEIYKIGRAYDSSLLRMRYAMVEQIFHELWAGEENMLKMRQYNDVSAQEAGQGLYGQYSTTQIRPEIQRHGAHIPGYAFPGKTLYPGQPQYSSQHRYQYDPDGSMMTGLNAPQRQSGGWPPPDPVLSQLPPYPTECYRPQSQRSSSLHKSQQPASEISSLPGLPTRWHPSPPQHQSDNRRSPSPLYPTDSLSSLPSPPSNGPAPSTHAPYRHPQSIPLPRPPDDYFDYQRVQEALFQQVEGADGSLPSQPSDHGPKTSTHRLLEINTLERQPTSRPIPGPTSDNVLDSYGYSLQTAEALSQEDLFQQVEDAVMGAGPTGVGSPSVSVSRPPCAPSRLGLQRDASIVNGHLTPASPQEGYSSDSDAEAAVGLRMLRMAEEDDRRRQGSGSRTHNQLPPKTHRRETSEERTAEEWRRLQAEELQDAIVDGVAVNATVDRILSGGHESTNGRLFDVKYGKETTLTAQQTVQASDPGENSGNTHITDGPVKGAHDAPEDQNWPFSPDDIGRPSIQHHGRDSDDDFFTDSDSDEIENVLEGKTDAVDELLRRWTTLDL